MRTPPSTAPLEAFTSDFSAQRAFHVDCLPISRRLRDVHYHANAEFGTILDGPGRLYYQDHLQDLSEGDVYLLDCVVPHGHESARGGVARNLYVHIKYDAVASLTPPDEYAAFMRPLMLVRAGILPPVIRNAPDIAAELNAAHACYAPHDRSGYVSAWTHVVAACAALLRRLDMLIDETAPSRAVSHDPTVIATALNHIGRHFVEPITVEEIAAQCFISPSRFAHVFTASIGIPPIAYRNSLRINRALELLQTTNNTVEQIALATGFKSFGQFRRLFKTSTGQTPRDYRRQQNRIGLRQE